VPTSYATRQTVPYAQLIVLPYTLLIDKQARQAIGLDLTNALVIIDEAHNLPAAIQAATCSKVSLHVLQASPKQLERYTQKYLDQLSSIHIKLLGQLKVVLKGLEQSLIQSKPSSSRQLPQQQPNTVLTARIEDPPKPFNPFHNSCVRTNSNPSIYFRFYDIFMTVAFH
jgi:chromosome transmission fidelity protein 1